MSGLGNRTLLPDSTLRLSWENKRIVGEFTDTNKNDVKVLFTKG